VLERLWWLVPATAVAIGLQRCVAAALVRSAAFGSIGLRSAVQSTAQLVVAFALAPLGGSLGLVLGPLVGRLAGSAALVRRRPRARRRTDRRALTVAARRTARRAVTSSGSAVLNASGLQLPITVLALAFSAGTIGLVAMAARLVTAPVAVLAEGLGHVHDARFGAVLRDRRPRATATALRTVGACSALAIVGAACVVGGAPVVVPALLGPSWTPAVPFVQLTTIGAAAQFVAVPISRSLTLLALPGRQLAWDAGRLVLTCGAVVAATASGLGPLGALTAWMVAAAVAYVVLVLVTLHGCRAWDAAQHGKMDVCPASTIPSPTRSPATTTPGPTPR
jgi:O-antigen/teichoic acid export membrane protein